MIKIRHAMMAAAAGVLLLWVGGLAAEGSARHDSGEPFSPGYWELVFGVVALFSGLLGVTALAGAVFIAAAAVIQKEFE